MGRPAYWASIPTRCAGECANSALIGANFARHPPLESYSCPPPWPLFASSIVCRKVAKVDGCPAPITMRYLHAQMALCSSAGLMAGGGQPMNAAFLHGVLLPPPAPGPAIFPWLCRPRAGGTADAGITLLI